MKDVNQSACEKALALVVDLIELTASSQDTLVLESSNDASNSNAFREPKMTDNTPVHHCNKEEVLEEGTIFFSFSFFFSNHLVCGYVVYMVMVYVCARTNYSLCTMLFF
jgi:hypothetical protein